MSERGNAVIQVDPGERFYRDAIVETPLQLDRTLVVSLEEIDAEGNPRGRTIAQRVGETWIWVLSGETVPGEIRRFRIAGPAEPSAWRHSLYVRGVRLIVLESEPEKDRALDVEIDGQYVATYNYGWRHAGLFKPYFHPVMSLTGVPITKNSEFPGTLRGHYWHRGLFVAHQRVNGISFWEERDGDGRILHQSFDVLEDGPVVGRFVERNLWRAPNGADLLEERREARFYGLLPNQRIIDMRISLAPIDEPVTLEQAAYNLLACHVPASMHVANPLSGYDRRMYRPQEMGPTVRGGRVASSEGEINVPHNHVTPGARGRWVDHSGPLDGRWQGLATMDHPTNPRYPTYWLNWNNMTHAPSFTFAEPYTIDLGQSLTLQYRIYIHDGNARTGGVEQCWQEYAFPPDVTLASE